MRRIVEFVDNCHYYKLDQVRIVCVNSNAHHYIGFLLSDIETQIRRCTLLHFRYSYGMDVHNMYKKHVHEYSFECTGILYDKLFNSLQLTGRLRRGFTLGQTDTLSLTGCHNASSELAPALNRRRRDVLVVMWYLNRRRKQRKIKCTCGVNVGPTSVNSAVQVIMPIISDPTTK